MRVKILRHDFPPQGGLPHRLSRRQQGLPSSFQGAAVFPSTRIQLLGRHGPPLNMPLVETERMVYI